MIVDFDGFTSEQQIELMEAADFFASILYHPRTKDVLYLEIERDPELNYEGLCVDIDRRHFQIVLRNLEDDDDIIRTLAHEMVHVQQHIKNRLTMRAKLAKNGAIDIAAYWDGVRWKPKKTEHPYYDAPWELEAYGKEVGLYQRWLKYKEWLHADSSG